MFERELAATAAAMVAPGKGILAIDESGATIKKRFDTIGVESSTESRRAYRDLLITPNGLSQYISGVILYDETLRQKSADGTPFPELMKKMGVMVNPHKAFVVTEEMPDYKPMEAKGEPYGGIEFIDLDI